MYEVLLKKAEETGGDIVECGVFREYPDRTEEHKRKKLELSGMEAVAMLLCGELVDAVWNKLWKHRNFDCICFPDRRVFEEKATTYRLFTDANFVCTISPGKYHYLCREWSLSRTHK